MNNRESGRLVVVVDGSNIATEGRSRPSLAQLNEAVLAYMAEHPDDTVTVVVDATFGHRIDKGEVAEFEAAVANNEVVAPPAGAVGRGDAFVLAIADKVDAVVLSNDSFQEFHGDYQWLFDSGRLVGGKPVPYVGWIFVDRVPVKGPTSRKATKSSRQRAAPISRRTASKEASLPMPVPTAPPPRTATAPMQSSSSTHAVDGSAPARPAPGREEPVNDLIPFIEFVERHPVGTSVNGVVDTYSSHGAYVTVDDVRGYVALRSMGDPPPRSARDVMKLGDAHTLVVASFNPGRRSIDFAVPKLVAPAVPMPDPDMIVEAVAEDVEARAHASSTRTRRAKRSPAPAAVTDDETATDAPTPATKPTPAKKTRAAPRPASPALVAASNATTVPAAASPVPPAEPAATDASDTATTAGKKATAKSATAKKSTTKKSTTTKASSATAKKSTGTKASVATAKKTPAKTSAAKKGAAKKAGATRSAGEDATPEVPVERAVTARPATKRRSMTTTPGAGTTPSNRSTVEQNERTTTTRSATTQATGRKATTHPGPTGGAARSARSGAKPAAAGPARDRSVPKPNDQHDAARAAAPRRATRTPGQPAKKRAARSTSSRRSASSEVAASQAVDAP